MDSHADADKGKVMARMVRQKATAGFFTALPFFSLLMLILVVPQTGKAESVAARNNKGNRLFEQGRWADAEKAYLSAQVSNPGKPELLYNLGNSLIKQKRYQQGVKALKQSIDKGDQELKNRGWFNTGNAHYLAGEYRESANAFIQALKLNPHDRDAKHNLELSLMKLKQQEQKGSEENRKQQGSDQEKEKARDNKQTQQKSVKNENTQGNRNEQPRYPDQTREAERREGSMTRERAIQLLDAVQNQEREEQRKMLERRSRERAKGKDW